MSAVLRRSQIRSSVRIVLGRATYLRYALEDLSAGITDLIAEPDEIWISSIMTSWWENTRDMIGACRYSFPTAVFRVGAISPTLALQHTRPRKRERRLTSGRHAHNCTARDNSIPATITFPVKMCARV